MFNNLYPDFFDDPGICGMPKDWVFSELIMDLHKDLPREIVPHCPENCEHTRMELVLRQFRHISFHTGMLNGQTALATGKFPMWVSQADKYVDDGIFFGRYRKGRVER